MSLLPKNEESQATSSDFSSHQYGIDFGHQLSKFAELSLVAGLNLQPGQEVVLRAPLEASPLVHRLSEIAYRRGAKLFSCLYEDPELLGSRLKYANDITLDHTNDWLSKGILKALENGAAHLSILGPYPDLLSDLPLERIFRIHNSLEKCASSEKSILTNLAVNYSAIPFVTSSWAKNVFPTLPPEKAKQKLWNVIFTASRLFSQDPLKTYADHIEQLNSRREFLQSRQLSALHFFNGDTDLNVGLLEGHRWEGGSKIAQNGIAHLSSLPTEELVTCTDPVLTNGRVLICKPLIVAGEYIKGARIEFRNGIVVSLYAEKGQDILEKLLQMDSGASRLGEVGLTPTTTPIAGIKTSFNNPLLDRNTACHISFGKPNSEYTPYDTTGQGKGVNKSSVHIDCMLSTEKMNVDGLHKSGLVEPLMRNGQFLI